MEQAAGVRRSRLDSLTSLRFVAALSVFGLHFLLAFPGSRITAVYHLVAQGSAGVSFFFILSGFVLTWSSRPGDTRRSFWRRRVARIYPMQVAAWVVTGLILWHYRGLPTKGPAFASLFLLTPWIPHRRYLDAMDASCWSLGCEAFFYLLFPYLLAFLERRDLRSRRILLAAAVLAVVALASVLVHAHPSTPRFWIIYYFPPVRLIEFVAGMLLGLEVRAGSWPRVPLRAALGVAAVAYVAASWAPPSLMVVAATFVPFIVLIGALAQSDADRRPTGLGGSALVRLGAWSYAFYLMHGPVLIVFAHLTHPPGYRATIAVAVPALAVSVAVAGACYRLIEHPFERAIRNHGRHRDPTTAVRLGGVVGLCLAATVSFVVVRP